MKFSANLGFLWNDRPLTEAIECARNAGFEAVEFHWPYEENLNEIKSAIEHSGLEVMGINAPKGISGDNGLAALPGRQVEARASIDHALVWAEALGAKNVHVLAGFAQGDEARDTLLENLSYAADRCGKTGIVVEALNDQDVPGYFYHRTDDALAVLADLNREEVGLMFDLYHLSVMSEPLIPSFDRAKAKIRHIQFAGYPGRQEPKPGEYEPFFAHLSQVGWSLPIGAEYRPQGSVEEGLNWRDWYPPNPKQS